MFRVFGAIGRYFRALGFLLTGQLDNARKTLDKNPNVMNAKYEEMIIELSRKIRQFTEAAGKNSSFVTKKKLDLKNKEEEILKLENVEFSVLFTPGHSPGSVSFYAKALNMLISGDVLFQRSIGRTDLPGGDMETLLTSIRNQLFVLPDETIVYSGHGHFTTIGDEKAENPFFS